MTGGTLLILLLGIMLAGFGALTMRRAARGGAPAARRRGIYLMLTGDVLLIAAVFQILRGAA
ncbi:hypothetical protein ACFQ1E_19145 [Sphingomonas canadensis]|uniref:HIG1 domain-containing protein n=1 Tax=Sphingomonas canadensis TaxID=1219257 RepID=A0ABW3HAI5_9SPHN|nr:hypothetical protein [Sphingomonas canadensis]MCW3838200.1 hypothetical protein [Sphingomonas canadensis]